MTDNFLKHHQLYSSKVFHQMCITAKKNWQFSWWLVFSMTSENTFKRCKNCLLYHLDDDQLRIQVSVVSIQVFNLHCTAEEFAWENRHRSVEKLTMNDTANAWFISLLNFLSSIVFSKEPWNHPLFGCNVTWQEYDHY